MNPLLQSHYAPLTKQIPHGSELLDNYNFLQSAKHSDKIYIAHNPIWPSTNKIVLPTNYDLYILAWGGEIVDVKWIDEVTTYIDPSKLILITDLEHVELSNVKKFTLTHHHQLPKLFEYTKDHIVDLSAYKSRKYKISCLQRGKDREHRINLANFLKDKNFFINNFDNNGLLWSDDQWEWRIEPYLNSLINITSESSFDTFDRYRPYTYLTEKTFKPIMAGCLGMHFGHPFGYKKLEGYGFLSANSLGFMYDDVLDDFKRFERFTIDLDNLLDYLTPKLSQMQEIVEYNHNWFWHKFYNSEKEKNRLNEQLILEYIDNYFR